MNAPLNTLLYPFETGLIDYPEKVLLYPAQAGASLQGFPSLYKWCVSKAQYDALPDAYTEEPDQVYDCVMVLPPKQKEEAQYVLAKGLSLLKDGGLFVAAAANDAGGKRLKNMAGELGLNVENESKHKARVVWGLKNSICDDVVREWMDLGSLRLVDMGDGVFYSCPGLFSWDQIDEASRLLVENLPALGGAGADFGCGYGYLTHFILDHHNVERLYAVDDDCRAIEAAGKNAEGAHVIWHDLRKPLSDIPRLDWVVMNPPFHTGKAVEIDLGRAFIQRAKEVLKPGGDLYLVANRHLPYEDVLKAQFTKFDIVIEKNGFKVIHARA